MYCFHIHRNFFYTNMDFPDRLCPAWTVTTKKKGPRGFGRKNFKIETQWIGDRMEI